MLGFLYIFLESANEFERLESGNLKFIICCTLFILFFIYKNYYLLIIVYLIFLLIKIIVYLTVHSLDLK